MNCSSFQNCVCHCVTGTSHLICVLAQSHIAEQQHQKKSNKITWKKTCHIVQILVFCLIRFCAHFFFGLILIQFVILPMRFIITFSILCCKLFFTSHVKRYCFLCVCLCLHGAQFSSQVISINLAKRYFAAFSISHTEAHINIISISIMIKNM